MGSLAKVYDFKSKEVLLEFVHAGFGFISGVQTQGYIACSTCGPNLSSIARLSFSSQIGISWSYYVSSYGT